MEPMTAETMSLIGDMIIGVSIVVAVLMSYLLYQVYVTHTYRPDLRDAGKKS